MLKFLRGKRFDLKTSVIALVVIGILWAIVIYAQARTAIPDEFREAPESTR